MNHATHTANPFYASRLKRVAPRIEARDRPVYARLPLAPRNASKARSRRPSPPPNEGKRREGQGSPKRL